MCWEIAHHEELLPWLLGIRITWPWSPTGQMSQNSPIWIQATDIMDERDMISRRTTLLHISSFFFRLAIYVLLLLEKRD
jgi:hypothetical protein